MFWRVLASRARHNEHLSEWNKLACIAMVMVGTNVADERTFSYMNYVTEQRPSLTTHLEVVVCMAEQTVFGLLDFFIGGSAPRMVGDRAAPVNGM